MGATHSWLISEHNGMQAIVHEEADGGLVIEHRQDVEAILDANRREMNDFDPHEARKREGAAARRVAHIPDVIIVRFLNEGINVFDPEHRDRLAKKLNDPEYAYLRTCPGTV